MNRFNVKWNRNTNVCLKGYKVAYYEIFSLNYLLSNCNSGCSLSKSQVEFTADVNHDGEFGITCPQLH